VFFGFCRPIRLRPIRLRPIRLRPIRLNSLYGCAAKAVFTQGEYKGNNGLGIHILWHCDAVLRVAALKFNAGLSTRGQCD